MRRGYTLTELILGMVVASILMLTVGLIATAGVNSYNKQRKEAEVYNDISSGVDFVERAIRRANIISFTANSLYGTWYNNTTSYTFTISLNTGNHNLTYSDTLYGTMKTSILGNVTSFSVVQDVSNSDLYNVTIAGTKDNVNFTRSLSVYRRNW